MLSSIPELTDGSYDWTCEDYIYSLLVEDDVTLCFLTPSRQIIYVVLPDVGMIRIFKNCKHWTDEQVADFVERLKNSIR